MTDLATTNSVTPTAPAAPDPHLLDGAVDYLNRATNKQGLDLARDVSDYVVATFLGGDPSQLGSKDPRKVDSLRALCSHPRLAMSATTLGRLVRIGVQARHLPQDLSEALSPGQHRALLTVENSQHKQHLARLAVRDGWTAVQLSAHIAAERPSPFAHGGRPKKAELLKWLAALRTASQRPLDRQQVAEEFAEFTEAQRAQAMADFAEVQAALQAVLVATEVAAVQPG